jgi:hypothetical protein
VADALPRRGCADEVLSISVATPQWLEEVISSYVPDPHASELVTKLSLQQDAVPG